MSFAGKVAVVTGAGRGIGRATAIALARAGAKVVLAAKGESNINKVKAEIESFGGEAMAVRTDVSVCSDIEELARRVEEHYGRVDLLVSNAGIHPHNEQNLPPRTLEIDEPIWDLVMDTNAKGTFFVCKAFLPMMVRQNYGRIVCVSSTTGINGQVASPHYCASKAAIIVLVKSLATEFGPYNITINCIAPGFVDTDMHAGEKPEVLEMIRQRTALRRLCQPEDVARAIMMFLVDDLFVTGQTLIVDGGASML
ncbi:MAG: 3-oxoacyl-ACP reductase FabG [Thermoleophilia bacterium]|nr:3-oxoacyl-ACP reductase FabG [Thermoleophilia bacterium]